MTGLPRCPACASDRVYEDGAVLVCPECGHEWSAEAVVRIDDVRRIHKDVVGNVLADDDSATVVKDLKVKGASSTLNAGTKVRQTRLVDEDHDTDCRRHGFGPMKLKSEFVRKVQG